MRLRLYDRKQHDLNYRNSHKSQIKKWNKNNVKKCHDNQRLKLIQILGSKCSNPNCLVPNGCNDVRCLQIDHINGNGNRDRRIMGGTIALVRYYLKNLDEAKNDLQILCANCNWIKRFINEECSKAYKLGYDP